MRAAKGPVQSITHGAIALSAGGPFKEAYICQRAARFCPPRPHSSRTKALSVHLLPRGCIRTTANHRRRDPLLPLDPLLDQDFASAKNERNHEFEQFQIHKNFRFRTPPPFVASNTCLPGSLSVHASSPLSPPPPCLYNVPPPPPTHGPHSYTRCNPCANMWR